MFLFWHAQGDRLVGDQRGSEIQVSVDTLVGTMGAFG